MRLHTKFITREIMRSRKQASVFVSCVILSVVSLVALNGFSRSVDQGMQADARELHAGDIIIQSHAPFTPRLEAALLQLQQKKGVRLTRIHEFYSVVRMATGKNSLLSHLKVVQPGYPLYGTVALKSKRLLDDVLAPGNVVVAQGFLDRLGLKVGEGIRVGNLSMTIVDVVLSEPDRPVDFFSFGPRVFISSKDLETIDLVENGSRVRYKALLKLPAGLDLEKTLAALQAAAEGEEQVHSFRTAGSRVKRFLDNFLFFLRLVGIFTLFLAGVGIQSALAAFLKEKETTIAIMKALGASSRFITAHFLLILSCLGLAGTLMGIAMATGVQMFLPVLFSGMLPTGMSLSVSWRALAEGFALGVIVVALFSFLPLHRLKEIRPGAVFKNEPTRSLEGRLTPLISITVGLLFAAMLLALIEDLRIGCYFITGATVLLLAIGLIVKIFLKGLRHLRIRHLPMRQAVKGLLRPRNATATILITLTASLTMIFSINLIEKNLDATFVRSFPPDTPNIFFLDIQSSQRAAFAEVIATPAIYYPIIRSRIVSINGLAIDRLREQRRRGDNLARPFNLTYRDYLLEDEHIISSGGLFQKQSEGIQVSVLDTVTDIYPLKIGDRITFRIQGVPLTATVSSIRGRTGEGLRPFFYFVFPEAALKDAPQTIFTALRVEPERIAPLQNQVVGRFPNISVIDVTQTVAVLSKLMARLSRIIHFFSGFGILAGLLILVSSVFATRIARTREAVYYKVLGARSRFVLTVFTMENALLGLTSSTLALFFSQIASWLTATRILDIGYRPFVAESLGAVVAVTLLITGVGLVPSVSILRHKPALFLRNQSQE